MFKMITCCSPLKIGTILFAFGEFIISAIALIGITTTYVYFEQNEIDILEMFADPPENLSWLKTFAHLENFGGTSIRIILLLSMLLWLQRTGLGLLLLNAVFREHRIHCQVWIVYSIVLLSLSCVGFLTAIMCGLLTFMSIPVYVGLFCIREYSMCLVSNFEKQFGGSYYEKTLVDW